MGRDLSKLKKVTIYTAAHDELYYDDLAGLVHTEFQDLNPESLREIELQVLRELLEDGLIEIGDSPYVKNAEGEWTIPRYRGDAADSQSGQNVATDQVPSAEEKQPWQLLRERGLPYLREIGFEPWSLSVSEAMAEIARRLEELGREPDRWEIMAFVLTERGYEAAWQSNPEWFQERLDAWLRRKNAEQS